MKPKDKLGSRRLPDPAYCLSTNRPEGHLIHCASNHSSLLLCLASSSLPLETHLQLYFLDKGFSVWQGWASCSVLWALLRNFPELLLSWLPTVLSFVSSQSGECLRDPHLWPSLTFLYILLNIYPMKNARMTFGICESQTELGLIAETLD